MYRGTRPMTICGPKRCSAPKTASGIAKHRLLEATILSRPCAAAISCFWTHTPITNSAMPAEHIATTVITNTPHPPEGVRHAGSPKAVGGTPHQIILHARRRLQAHLSMRRSGHSGHRRGHRFPRPIVGVDFTEGVACVAQDWRRTVAGRPCYVARREQRLRRWSDFPSDSAALRIPPDPSLERTWADARDLVLDGRSIRMNTA